MSADPVTADVAAPHRSFAAADSAPDDLPRGWAWTTLGEIASVQLGKMLSPKAFDDGLAQLPYLRNENVRWGTIDFADVKQMGFKTSELEKYSVRPGDLLVCEGGEPGRCAIYRGDLGAYMYQKALHRVRTYPDAVLPELIQFCFQHYTYSQTMLPRMSETTIQHLPLEKMLAVRLPLPPLAEQRRIVAAIEQQFTRLDAGVAALRRAQTALKRYRAAVLKAAVEGRLTDDWRRTHPDAEPALTLLARILAARRARWEADLRAKGKDPARTRYPEPAAPDTTSLPALPDGWCWATVDQIGEIQGGIQKQPSRTPKDHAYPYLRVANVLRGRLDLREIEHMELFGSELETLRLQPGDLLIVEGNGSRSEIGRSAMWRGEIEDCVHQNHIIRVRARGVLPRYLDYFWNSPDGSNRVIHVAASTSGLYTLSIGKISKLPVPLPPLTEQQAIVAEVERRLSVVAELEAAVAANLARAERLRQAILREAFAGRLVPQHPADEPASALLERIRREREEATSGNQRQEHAKPDVPVAVPTSLWGDAEHNR